MTLHTSKFLPVSLWQSCTCATMEVWKSTLINTYTNFGHICQKKMPSPSEADSRQSIHWFPHWPKKL